MQKRVGSLTVQRRKHLAGAFQVPNKGIRHLKIPASFFLAACCLYQSPAESRIFFRTFLLSGCGFSPVRFQPAGFFLPVFHPACRKKKPFCPRIRRRAPTQAGGRKRIALILLSQRKQEKPADASPGFSFGENFF